MHGNEEDIESIKFYLIEFFQNNYLFEMNGTYFFFQFRI